MIGQIFDFVKGFKLAGELQKIPNVAVDKVLLSIVWMRASEMRIQLG